MTRRLLTGLSALASLLVARGVAAEADPRGSTAWALSRAAAEVRAYRESVGELPASREGIEGVVSDPASLVDGWGRPVIYLRVAGGFWLVSWGADGVPGGTGDAEDVVEISR